VNETPEARGNEWKSVSGNNQLGVSVAAHAVDRAGRASADGVGVATRMLGGDGNGAIRAAYDGALMIEWVGAAVIDHEARVLGIAHKGHGRPHLNTEGFVGLGVWNTRSCGGIRTPAAPDVDGAGRRSGTTCVRCGTDFGGIGSRADIVLNFLFCVLANNEASQEERRDEHETKNR
jgi:hypothetical protein